MAKSMYCGLVGGVYRMMTRNEAILFGALPHKEVRVTVQGPGNRFRWQTMTVPPLHVRVTVSDEEIKQLWSTKDADR